MWDSAVIQSLLTGNQGGHAGNSPDRVQAAMVERFSKSHFYDPRNGEPAIGIQPVAMEARAFEPERTNCFRIYLIESGSGEFWADASQFEFTPSSLLFFVPYQHVRFEPRFPVQGKIIQFHANFLCVETFHAEAGCSGILFNDPYGVPLVKLDDSSRTEMIRMMEQIQHEQTMQALAYHEVMLANLKVLLILATRLKSQWVAACHTTIDLRHPMLAELSELIEQNYRTLHSPSDYADKLHVTAKSLGRIVRERLGTTLSDLIRNRILIHAKWQLLHTLRPVKEIARELGFTDELYFSRLFKKATGVSPTFFREFETEIRNGSNLSMFSRQTPIQPVTVPSDT